EGVIRAAESPLLDLWGAPPARRGAGCLGRFRRREARSMSDHRPPVPVIRRWPKVHAWMGAAAFLATIWIGHGRAHAACGALLPGEALYAGQAVWSCDGYYVLTMQGDGNLVLYLLGGTPVWSSQTWSYPGAVAVMQGDGNLVIYQGNTPVWYTWTFAAGAFLAIQNDGNLVVYGAGT